MDLKQFQNEVKELFDKISEKRNVRQAKEDLFIHLIEEIGELARQITNEKIRREKFDLENLKEEIADSIIFLTLLASQYNIDLPETLKKDIEKLKIKFGIEQV